MDRTILVACFAVAATLVMAGCVEGPAAESPTTEVPGPLADAVTFPFAHEGRGCARALLAAPLGADHAQSFLPAGFTAADATEFFGREGLLTGSAMALLQTVSCPGAAGGVGHAEASLGILVQPPELEGTGLPSAHDHVYELARVADGPALRGTLAGLQWPLVGDAVDLAFSAQPVPSGSASASNAGQPLWTLATQAGTYPDSLDIDIAWWHETDAGVGMFHYVFHVDGQVGPATCTLAAGAVADEVLGGTSCPPGSLLMVGPPLDLAVRMAWLPYAD